MTAMPVISLPVGPVVGSLAALLGSDAEGRAAIDASRRALKRGQADLHVQLAALARLRQEVSAELANKDQLAADLPIESALAAERKLTADHKALVRASTTILRQMKRDGISHAEQVHALLQQFEAMVVELLEGLRDHRWQLMSMRAERPGAKRGPVLSHAKALRRHLGRVAD